MTEEHDKYPVKITRKGIFIWSGLIFFAMGWMFVVGILVGRGMAPIPEHRPALQQELETLKKEKLAEDRANADTQAKPDVEKNPHLPFYEELKKPAPKTAYKVTPPAPPKRTATPAPVAAPQPEKPAAPPAAAPAEKPVQKPAPESKPAVETKAAAAPAAKPAPAAARPGRSRDRFTVQVGAFKDAQSADQMVKSLRDKGYPAYHLRVEVPGKGVWFRVRVGAFKDRSAAEAMLKKMDRQGVKGMVVNT